MAQQVETTLAESSLMSCMRALHHFADDIDGLAGEEEELANLVERLECIAPLC